MIVYATLILGFLVFIHEGGHYLAARAFGVRVTEFMLGLPGPNIGFTKWGTKFGVTPFLLGGYAKVCGMEPGEMSPHLEPVLAALYRRGTANMEDIAQRLRHHRRRGVRSARRARRMGQHRRPHQARQVQHVPRPVARSQARSR